MTVSEARAKQAALDAVKALFDAGDLTWEELYEQLGSRRLPYSIAVAVSLAKRPQRAIDAALKNNSSPAA